MEAALVFPVIILTVITAVLVVLFFYSQMTERSGMHIALRSEAGFLTERTVYSHAPEFDGAVDADGRAIIGRVTGRKQLLMDHRGILKKKGTFVVEGSAYAIDGPRYVRYCNLVKGGGHEQENPHENED